MKLGGRHAFRGSKLRPAKAIGFITAGGLVGGLAGSIVGSMIGKKLKRRSNLSITPTFYKDKQSTTYGANVQFNF